MFYDRFVHLCAQRNISPSKAAVEAGLSKSTVSKWKSTPEAEPTGNALKKLSEYFGISIAEVLGSEKEVPSSVPHKQNDILDEVDLAFYDGYRELSEDDKETVRDMVRVMRERRAKKQEK